LVGSQPPKLEINAPTKDAIFENLQGTAWDHLAIRAIRWENDRGGKGATRMTWNVLGGNGKSGYDWQVDWSIDGIALQPGANSQVPTWQDVAICSPRVKQFAACKTVFHSRVGLATVGYNRRHPEVTLAIDHHARSQDP
jgi:hypothetical protein